MNYSIDGKYGGTIPLVAKNPTEMHIINTMDGSVELPELSEGPHCLTVYELSGIYDYHGANAPGPPFKPASPGSADYVASWIHTVYFTVSSLSPSSPSPTSPSIPSSNVSFSPSDSFAIPALNSKVNFAYNGSYSVATTENNFWSFSGLKLSGLGSSVGESHSLDVSAENCSVIITHVDTLSFLNHDQVGWLTYNVNGIGNQTFNMHWCAEGFVVGFKVYIDGEVKDSGNEWTVWPGKNPVTDNMLTVTGAKHNVSIGYAINPETIGLEPNFAPLPSPTPLPSPSPSSTPSPTLIVCPTITPSPSPNYDKDQTDNASNGNFSIPANAVPTIPRFPAWAVLLLFAVLAALVVVYIKRKS